MAMKKTKLTKILLFYSVFIPSFTREIRQVERCPSRAERLKLQKVHNCSNLVYHCLLDDDGLYKETCNDFIQLPPGQFPRYSTHSDRIYYTECPGDRYQPWPVKSYEITEFGLVKSTCSSLGQLVCNNGSSTEDRRCGCDYKKGYVPGGVSSCCFPSDESDCFCIHRPCSSETQELNADYRCVDKCPPGHFRPDGENNCKKGSETTRPGFTTSMIGMIEPEGYLEKCLSDAEYPRGRDASDIPVVATITLIAVVGGVFSFVYLSIRRLGKKRRTWDEKYERRVYQLIEAAKNGDIDTVKSFKDEGYIGLHESDIFGRTALHLAACEGHVQVTKFLVQHKGYKGSKDRCKGFTPEEDCEWHLKHCSNDQDKENFEQVKSSLSSSRSNETTKIYFKENVAVKLIKAAEDNNKDELERLFNLKTEMNLADTSGKTALHAAAENNHIEIIKYLLDICQVSPFSRLKSDGKRPMDLTTDDNVTKVLKSAMDAHIVHIKPMDRGQDNLDMKTVDNIDAMDTASKISKINKLFRWASDGNLRQIKKWFHKHPSVLSLPNYDKRTALHVAVSFEQEHVVKYLLEVGKLKESVEDRWHITPLMMAKENGKRKIFQLFLDLCPNVANTESDEYKTYCLLMAGKEGNINVLKSLRKKGVDMNLQDYDGRTALHLAAAEDKQEAVVYLIQQCGCNVKINDRYGRTAESVINKETLNHLERTNKNENKEMLDTLARSEVKKPERVRWKTHSVKLSSTKSTFVSDWGENLPSQITDKSNMYVIFEAAAKGDLNTLKGCEYPFYDAIDYFNNTPLHVAASAGHKEIVQYLIDERNASPFIRNSIRKRPLDLVEDRIQCLVSTAATMENLSQRQRFTQVKSCLYRKINSIINSSEPLYDKSFPMYEEDVQVFMLLNRTFKGDIRSIRGYLSQKPSLINKQDYDGRTALHVAVAEMHEHLVNYFLTELKDEIDCDIPDRWGHTPITEVARYEEVVGEKIEEYDSIVAMIRKFQNKSHDT